MLLPVLVIVAAHSWFVSARMFRTGKMEDPFQTSWESMQQLGAVLWGLTNKRGIRHAR